ncbi:MAG: hypothetical protein HY927_16810 [Elusimicrobia bacterium]|nr:hypothetical protein [Elusimicrobiota bacterium]
MAEDHQISFEEYVGAVSRFNCAQGLAKIAQLSRTLELKLPELDQSIFRRWHPQTVNQWQLACFAKTLIVTSNDYKRKEVTDQALLWACDRYNQVVDPRVGNPSVQPTERDILDFFIRTSFEQFPYQMLNYRNDISRALILFEEIADLAKGEGFDIAACFWNIAGLSIRDFLLIGVAYWAFAGRPIPSPLTTSAASLQGVLTPEKQARFLALTAADYTTFRTCQAQQEKRPGFERFEFNCLNIFPLIKPDRLNLLCPIPTLLLRRFTRGIYYFLLDASSKGGKENPFSTFFGKSIFERYVGILLKEHFQPDKVLQERDLGSEKTCDWIVEDGDFVLLIECKTTGLTIRAKSFADGQQVEDDLKKRIIGGVRACERTRLAIANDQAGLGFLAGKHPVNLIVLYDEVYLFNAPPYRTIVNAELKKAGLEGVSYHVTPIAELEWAFPSLHEAGLGKSLREKLADAELVSWDFVSFTQRLIKEKRVKDADGRNPLLDAKFEEVFQPLLRPGAPDFE